MLTQSSLKRDFELKFTISGILLEDSKIVASEDSELSQPAFHAQSY